MPYIEAIRQLRWKLGTENCLVVHLTLLPYLSAAAELKTKPTQHSVKELLMLGIQPDVLICRTEHSITSEIKQKISLFCNIETNSIIEAIDAASIYDVPLMMLKEKLDSVILSKLHMAERSEPQLTPWKNFLDKLKNPKRIVHVALIGKYVELQDAYKSILESFIHAGSVNECSVKIHMIHSENIVEYNLAEKLKGMHGILIAPGFGERGIEGKIMAVQYARENNLPFFGICLGMQCAVIEFARHVLHLLDAHSTEMIPETINPVIDMMEQQKQVTQKGGTMRLGSYECTLKEESKAYQSYNQIIIHERHRHRFEFNNAYLEQYQAAGMVITGVNTESNLVEIIEIPSHPWFVGVQFHPELKSTVENPHPLFIGFVKACINELRT